MNTKSILFGLSLIFSTQAAFSPAANARPLSSETKALMENFDRMVRKDQGEYEFSLTLKKFQANEYNNYSSVIAAHELSEISGTANVISFNFDSLVPFDKKLAEVVTGLIFDWHGGGFFCDTFLQTPDPDGYIHSDECRKSTLELLEPINPKRGSNGHSTQSFSSVFLILHHSESWGDYDGAILYLQDKVDPNTFVRIYFDLVHEI